jgi:hypothetical protein
MAMPDSEYQKLKFACGSEMPNLKALSERYLTSGALHRTGTAAGTIPANRLVKGHTDGTLLVGTLGSLRILGVNAGDAVVATDTVDLSTGLVDVVAAEPILAGDNLKCGDNGRVLQMADADNLNTVIGTGTAGNFGNQPQNDGVEIISDAAGDTTQSITIIGTTQATDTLVSETVALNGTTQVSTTKTDWGFIVAVKLSASCAGTVTVREASANATIITLATTVLSAGVVEVAAAAQGAHGLIPYIKAAGASTKTVGVLYEPATGAADALMAEALNGTTAAPLPAAANLIKEIYLGDVATGTVATVYTNATEDDENVRVGRATEDIATGATGEAFVTV